jgi:hypothetical protein
MEDRLPKQGEDEHDQRGDGHGFQRDRPTLLLRRVGRKRGEQHRRIDGTDHCKEGGKGREEGFEHVIDGASVAQELGF